jgi:glycosyltransferase involved in cell wall biosynthesis
LIRVAIWYNIPIAYSGGLNYVRNLLYAVSLVNKGRISPYIFLGTTADKKTADEFSALATVVRTPVLDRMSAPWLFNRMLVKSAGIQYLVRRELKKHGIEVVSHATQMGSLGAPFRVIFWVPDFQFLHLPNFFPGLDANEEKRRLRKMISRADAIVLSSQAAYEDFRSIAQEESVARARVLQFVSQPDLRLNVVDDAVSKGTIERRYGFNGKYFYLPNQFWVHKNHWLVFKAVAELKARGTDVLIICTGNLTDFRIRNNEHVEALKRFITQQSLERNLLILGLIPYEDVLFLMRNCLAVINPSRFEGWSSTVEEAKSIGKRIVLSNIPVHLEQKPNGAQYFDPDDVAGLASILRQIWNDPITVDSGLQSKAAESLRERTLAYGEAYIELVEQVQSGRIRP